jgi:mRNA interferase HicA
MNRRALLFRYGSRDTQTAENGLAYINKIVYDLPMKSSELKRWLAEHGATFKPGKGSHLRVFLNGRQSTLPMHNKELGAGLVAAIKKQLGLK